MGGISWKVISLERSSGFWLGVDCREDRWVELLHSLLLSLLYFRVIEQSMGSSEVVSWFFFFSTTIFCFSRGCGMGWILFWKRSGILCDGLLYVGLFRCAHSGGSHFGSRNIGVVSLLLVRSVVLFFFPANRLPSLLLVGRVGGWIGRLRDLCLSATFSVAAAFGSAACWFCFLLCGQNFTKCPTLQGQQCGLLPSTTIINCLSL